MAYAIIDIGGKQYRVEKGDSVVVDRVDAEPGSKLSPRAVLFADGKQSIAGGAEADKIKVDAVVAEHVKGDKIRVFKYKAKKRYRVTTGHRSALTRLEITGITASGAGAKATPKPAADKPDAEKKPAPAKQPAEKKPATKKPAAKRPAAKKPAAKKPLAKKPAPKKDD